MECKMDGRMQRAALAVLWIVALSTVAMQASADCAAPAEVADLAIESVTFDGAPVDDLTVYGEGGGFMRAEGFEVMLRFGDYQEWFGPAEVDQ